MKKVVRTVHRDCADHLSMASFPLSRKKFTKSETHPGSQPDHPVTIMVVVLLSETKGPGFAARLRASVQVFSRGRQVIWVPAVPDRRDQSEDFPSKLAWPDDDSGAVPGAGESLKAPGGDPALSSGPSADLGNRNRFRLFRVNGTRVVAGNWEGINGHRPLSRPESGGKCFPGRRRRSRWKDYFSTRSRP